MKKVVAVVSGGLDSTTVLARLMSKELEIYPMTFNYGQRHSIERLRLGNILQWFKDRKLTHKGQPKPHYKYFVGELKELYDVQLPRIDCLLTSDGEDLPKGDVDRKGVAPTYVPGRNLIFIAHACSYAEVLGAELVYVGVNALDYSGYPDCRPEFIQAVNAVQEVGTETGIKGKPIEVYAPLMHMTKAQIIREGVLIAAPLHLTWSCYKGEEPPCGKCDSCKIRAKGFKDAVRRDPAISRPDSDKYSPDEGWN